MNVTFPGPFSAASAEAEPTTSGLIVSDGGVISLSCDQTMLINKTLAKKFTNLCLIDVIIN